MSFATPTKPAARTKAPRIALIAAALLAILSLAFAGSAEAAKQQRIVALTPFTANTLAQLGVKPIAVGQTLDDDRQLSKKLRNVKVLPLAHPYGANLEQIAALNPDLVLTSPQWRKGSAGIRQLGVKVIEMDPPSIGKVYSETKRIGRLVRKPRAAAKLVKRMKKSVGKATAGISGNPSVMVILGVGRRPFTFLDNSWGGQIVKRAGGDLETAGASSASGFAAISDEQVIAADPEVIIAVPHGNSADIPELEEYFRNHPVWSATSAAQNGRIFVSTDNSLLQAGTDVARVIRKVRGYLGT